MARIVGNLYFLYGNRSTTLQRKINGVGFSSRLEERAEKRKEVFAATALYSFNVVISNALY